MRIHIFCRVLTSSVFTALLALALPLAAGAQGTTASQSPIPADPWPRVIDLANGQVLVYQPQINSWTGNQLDFRAALALKPEGAKEEIFGVVFASARTQVDKIARTVVYENMKISKLDFPTLPDHGAAYSTELKADFIKTIGSISLDRMEAALAAAGIKATPIEVNNTPPQVIVSYTPAILVPIDGAPVIKPTSDSRFQRVVNTRALILQGGLEQNFFIHVYDGWLSSSSISGPWALSSFQPLGMDSLAQQIAKSGGVDMLDGGPKANPKPSLANGVPTIYTTQVPTELIVFNGQPDFVPVNADTTAVGFQHDQRRADRYVEQPLLRADVGALVPLGGADRSLDLRRGQCAAAGLRENSADCARGCGPADGRRHAAGAGSGDLELDSADRHGAA